MDDVLASVTELARSYVDSEAAGALDSPDADLRSIGLTSLKMVQFMVALEDAFSITFPEHLISADTFRTPRTMSVAVLAIQSGAAAAR